MFHQTFSKIRLGKKKKKDDIDILLSKKDSLLEKINKEDNIIERENLSDEIDNIEINVSEKVADKNLKQIKGVGTKSHKTKSHKFQVS